MNDKSNSFRMLHLLLLALVLGFLFPRIPWKGDSGSQLGSKIEMILEKEPALKSNPFDRKFISYLIQIAKDYEFDPLLILAIMKVESSFDPEAVSFAGAYGLLQIKPVAAKEVAQTFGTELYEAEDLTDPFVNVRVGVQYLSYLRDVVGKNPVRMLAAYNLGPTHVRRYGHNLRYASKVLDAYRGYLGM